MWIGNWERKQNKDFFSIEFYISLISFSLEEGKPALKYFPWEFVKLAERYFWNKNKKKCKKN
jgi:hypothetical protein